jgi:hypothetical protein
VWPFIDGLIEDEIKMSRWFTETEASESRTALKIMFYAQSFYNTETCLNAITRSREM